MNLFSIIVICSPYYGYLTHFGYDSDVSVIYRACVLHVPVVISYLTKYYTFIRQFFVFIYNVYLKYLKISFLYKLLYLSSFYEGFYVARKNKSLRK